MKTNNRTVIGWRRGYGRLLLKKTWFEISEIPRAHWNGTFRLHRLDISHRVFGYCSCKQDTKERHWGQQFWQRALSRLVKISGISGSAVNGTRFVDSSHWKIPRKVENSDRNDQTGQSGSPSKLVPNILVGTNRHFWNFGLNGKRPLSNWIGRIFIASKKLSEYLVF